MLKVKNLHARSSLSSALLHHHQPNCPRLVLVTDRLPLHARGGLSRPLHLLL